MKVYVFQAALLCEGCAEQTIEALERTTGKPPLEQREDSDVWPQGPYGQGGGEADCPQSCDHCFAFLENPLTEDGANYVREQVMLAGLEETDSDTSWAEIANKADDIGKPVLAEWIRYYLAPGM